MDEYNVVLWIGTGVLALVAPVALWLLIDYCVVTPLQRMSAERGKSDEEHVYIPWWENGIGIVWAGLIFSIALMVCFVDISRFITLRDGPNWPGREWVSLCVYSVILATMLLTGFVYAIEKTAPTLILVGKRRRALEARRHAALQNTTPAE